MPILLLIVIALILFLLFLGVYGDMAKRTDFPITGRVSFLSAPVVYALTILVLFLPVVYFVFSPLLSMSLIDIVVFLIPLGLGAFGLLVIIGALPLWGLHHKAASFKQCILLSTRLMLSPVIDVFWAFVAVFIGTTIAAPAFLISKLIDYYRVFQSVRAWDFGSSLQQLLSPSYIFPIVFLVFGLVFAYFIFKQGPSKVLAWYLYLMRLGALGVGIVVMVVLFLFLGFPGLIGGFILLIIVGILTLPLYILGWLFEHLRIAGVFGLSIAVLSGLLLALVYLLGDIPSIPFVEDIIYVMRTVGLELGVVGLVSGIIIIVLARRTEETGQVMTRAMAISVGVSSFMPLLSFIIVPLFVSQLPFGFGASLGVLFRTLGIQQILALLFILPIYLISVVLLRLGLALNIIVRPPSQKPVTPTPTPTKPKFPPVQPIIQPKVYGSSPTLIRVAFIFSLLGSIFYAINGILWGVILGWAQYTYTPEPGVQVVFPPQFLFIFGIYSIIALVGNIWLVTRTAGIRGAIKYSDAPTASRLCTTALGVLAIIFGNIIAGILLLLAKRGIQNAQTTQTVPTPSDVPTPATGEM